MASPRRERKGFGLLHEMLGSPAGAPAREAAPSPAGGRSGRGGRKEGLNSLYELLGDSSPSATNDSRRDACETLAVDTASPPSSGSGGGAAVAERRAAREADRRQVCIILYWARALCLSSCSSRAHLICKAPRA